MQVISRGRHASPRVGAALNKATSSVPAQTQTRGILHGGFGGDSTKGEEEKTGYLVLEDGSIYKGTSFGASTSVAGEAVFNTGMVGYPESLTDPSYRGQLLTFTYPSIGNYGVPPDTVDEFGLEKFFESDRIHTAGVIVADYSWEYSHWNATQSLSSWLKSENIPALSGIDTRELTKKLRDQGTMLAKIIFEDDIPFDNPNERDLVREVSTKVPVYYGKPGGFNVIAVDCGIKHNVIRSLVAKGCYVKLVPFDYDFLPDLQSDNWDGLFISNGPGDPDMLQTTIENVRLAFSISKPIFGICMGNHVIAKAAGASTFKLRYGNRGQNQPVVDAMSNKAYITPQNHGYAVDTSTLRPPWKQMFYNANDFSNEGIICEGRPFYSVQFHPEAKGGPYDTDFLFDKFITHMREQRKTTNKYYTLPAKRDVSKVLILGSGGLQIGQAGEFDYSGSQAIKALKEEGVKSVLINPNIATVQTAKGLADRVYFLPVTTEMVEKIIEKEKPDGILLGFGGQTGLNTGVDLYQKGILQKHNVSVLGTSVETIIATEDREIFKNKLLEINEKVAPSMPCTNIPDSLEAAENIGYPVIIRSAFSLGGLGSGFADNKEELEELCARAFAVAPQILVEKSVKGWKEVEYEVVRDTFNNCVTVCNMENFDPMGIHTGESIVVAPSQTLSNEEYHKLRLTAIRVVQHLGIVGECNIQYALDPLSEEYYIIEVNPRLSRSSALASKATGYPLAAVAAKLSLGMEIPSITNSITKTTTACFEPSLDYMVVKMPRWDMDKFGHVEPQLGSAMKSVGEVMSIGRNFEEALQKAIRMVDGGNTGFDSKPQWRAADEATIDVELAKPTPRRIFALAEALDRGYSMERIRELTKIDPWWLMKLIGIQKLRAALRDCGSLEHLSRELMGKAKVGGFSDKQIAALVGSDEMSVRATRKKKGIIPFVKQIDTLAAEFPALTNYLYMTYGGKNNDLEPDAGAVMVLGSGVYRIGSSVEFDYGAVHAVRSLARMRQKTVLINYNPETVSTDYDESERLYFEELSKERVMDIHEFEKCSGVIVSVGGQQPQNLALPLYEENLPILGTSPLMIDNAEDRHKFSQMLDDIGVDQPEWQELTGLAEAAVFADRVGYPVLVRPSYVLSGAAMKVAWNKEQLDEFLTDAADVSPDHPVVMTKFYEDHNEIELDAVANKGEIVNWAVSEHVELAGVHSGDASLVFPAVTTPQAIQDNVRDIGAKIAKALEISGPFNMQLLQKGDWLGVIECNLRSSRSFPFVSKALNIDFIDTAVQVFMGKETKKNPKCEVAPKHISVKAPQFSYARLPGTDPILGVEMASTGEVACYGETRHEAYLKAILAVGFKVPKKNVLVSGDVDANMIDTIKCMVTNLGLTIFGTPEVANLLEEHSIPFNAIQIDDCLPMFKAREIDLVMNFPFHQDPTIEMRVLRRNAINFAVPIITNKNLAKMTVESLDLVGDNLSIVGWDEYFPEETQPY